MNTVGLAGSIGTLAEVLDALPGTSIQLSEMPMLRLLVCNCKTQPRYSAGQFNEMAPPETLFVKVGGDSGATVATDTVPSTARFDVFQVTNCPGVCDTMLNAPE